MWPARHGRCAQDGTRSCRGGRPAPVSAPAASPPQSAPPGRPCWARRANARLPHDLSVSPRPAPDPGSSSPSSSVPQPVQVVPQLLLEHADTDRVHARRPVIGPAFSHASTMRRLSISNDFIFGRAWPSAPPLRVGPGLTLVCTAPWLQPHYRTFLATMSRPAPVPRLGTLPLAVSAARGPPSRGQRGTLAPITWPSLSGRQVLLFRASARDELTPPLHRAPPGQHAGRPRLRARIRAPLSRELVPPRF